MSSEQDELRGRLLTLPGLVRVAPGEVVLVDGSVVEVSSELFEAGDVYTLPTEFAYQLMSGDRYGHLLKKNPYGNHAVYAYPPDAPELDL